MKNHKKGTWKTILTILNFCCLLPKNFITSGKNYVKTWILSSLIFQIEMSPSFVHIIRSRYYCFPSFFVQDWKYWAKPSNLNDVGSGTQNQKKIASGKPFQNFRQSFPKKTNNNAQHTHKKLHRSPQNSREQSNTKKGEKKVIFPTPSVHPPPEGSHSYLVGQCWRADIQPPANTPWGGTANCSAEAWSSRVVRNGTPGVRMAGVGGVPEVCERRQLFQWQFHTDTSRDTRLSWGGGVIPGLHAPSPIHPTSKNALFCPHFCRPLLEAQRGNSELGVVCWTAPVLCPPLKCVYFCSGRENGGRGFQFGFGQNDIVLGSGMLVWDNHST